MVPDEQQSLLTFDMLNSPKFVIVTSAAQWPSLFFYFRNLSFGSLACLQVGRLPSKYLQWIYRDSKLVW
jgi:hypothetical protein